MCDGFPRQVRRSRHQLYKFIDGDYYGFRDEEDGLLLKAEAKAEAYLREKVGESAEDLLTTQPNL